MATKPTQSAIEIKPINVEEITIYLIGLTDFLCNRMTPETMETLRKKEAGEKSPVGNKDFDLMYEQSCFRMEGGEIAWTSRALLMAMSEETVMLKDMHKVDIFRTVRVGPPLVELHGKPYKYDAIGRSGGMGKTPIFRRRMAIKGWWCKVKLTFEPNIILIESLVNLINNSGRHIGMGDFRPGLKGGEFGQYRVATDAEAKKLEKGK